MLAFLCLICVALPPCLDCSRRSSLALLLHSFPVSVRPSVSVSVSVSVCRGVSIKVTKQQRQCSVLMLQQVMLLSPPLYHTHEHAILQSAQKQWEHTFSMTPFCTHTGARAHTHAHAHTHTHTHARTHTHTHTVSASVSFFGFCLPCRQRFRKDGSMTDEEENYFSEDSLDDEPNTAESTDQE